MGFVVPPSRWFREPQRQRMRSSLLEGPVLENYWFNLPVVRQLIEQHEPGRSVQSTTLWTLLMFDTFLRNSLSEVQLATALAAA
jgi:asparagine synthase (glutamine-hydrolysing)